MSLASLSAMWSTSAFSPDWEGGWSAMLLTSAFSTDWEGG